MAALGLAFLIEHLDDTIKSPDDVTAVTELPTLGVISQMRNLGKKAGPDGLVTLEIAPVACGRGFQDAPHEPGLSQLDTPLRTLLVTSAVPGEGKSTCLRQYRHRVRADGQERAARGCRHAAALPAPACSSCPTRSA
jgi:polysaccharide biosynthesis transport protein